MNTSDNDLHCKTYNFQWSYPAHHWQYHHNLTPFRHYNSSRRSPSPNLTNSAKLKTTSILYSLLCLLLKNSVFFTVKTDKSLRGLITDLKQRLFTCHDYCVNGLHIQSTDIKFNSFLLKLEKASLFRLIYTEKLRCMYFAYDKTTLNLNDILTWTLPRDSFSRVRVAILSLLKARGIRSESSAYLYATHATKV